MKRLKLSSLHERYPLLLNGVKEMECPICTRVCYPFLIKDGTTRYNYHECIPKHGTLRSIEVDSVGEVRIAPDFPDFKNN